MEFTTFIYFFGDVCFAVAITTLLFVAVDIIEGKH